MISIIESPSLRTQISFSCFVTEEAIYKVAVRIRLYGSPASGPQWLLVTVRHKN